MEGIFVTVNETNFDEFRNVNLQDGQARRMWLGSCVDANIVYDRAKYTLEALSQEYHFDYEGNKVRGVFTSHRAPLYTGVQEDVGYALDGISPNYGIPRTGHFDLYQNDGISNLRVERIPYSQDGYVYGYLAQIGVGTNTVPCRGGVVNIVPQFYIKYGQHGEWQQPVNDVRMDVYINGSFWRSYDSFDSEGYTIYSNYHTTNARTYDVFCTITYEGVTYTSSSIIVTQDGDTWQEVRTYNTDYTAYIEAVDSVISCASSQTSLIWSASHFTVHVNAWDSDGSEFEGRRDKITDTPTITKTSGSSRFWLQGTTLHHDSMGRIAGVDSATYTATNGGATRSVTITTTENVRSLRDYDKDGTFQIGGTVSTVPMGGGTYTLTATILHVYEDYYTAAPYWVQYDQELVNVKSSTVFTTSGTVRLNYSNNAVFDSRRHVDGDGVWSITGQYDGSTYTLSGTQTGDSYHLEHTDREGDNCRIYIDTAEGGSITANGGYVYLNWSAEHYMQEYNAWDSDGVEFAGARRRVDDRNNATISELGDTYYGYSFNRTTRKVTHLDMEDNYRLTGRGKDATESVSYKITNGEASDTVTLDSVTNHWLGKKYGTPTASYSGLDNDIYYDGTEVPVMIGISQQSWQAYDAGNYDIQTEGYTVLADSVTGTAYGEGYKSGSYIGAGELTTTTARRRVYVISSVKYYDRGGTLRTFSSSKTIYQESLTVTDTHFYEITKFTVSNETTKVIGWGYQSNLPIYTEGRARTDKHYIAGDGLPERPEWDVPGTWDIASGRSMGISGRGATGFIIPTNTSSSGTANLGCSQNTGDADRTLTLTASYGGQTATCTVTQEHRTAITITLFVGASTRTVRCNADSAVNSNLMMEVSVEWVRSGGLTFIREYSVPITNGATSGQVTESATGIVGVRTYKILTIQKGAGDTTEYINGTP